MKINIYLDDNRNFRCDNLIIGKTYENEATKLWFMLDEEMYNKDFYLEFEKIDGTKFSTPKLEIQEEYLTEEDGGTIGNGVTINKLTLSKYRELKNSNSLSKNESYVITDIDEQLPIYKASENTSNPIILRNLDTGIYKIYGYFKYYSSQSGISGVDPFAYVIVEKGTSYSYVTIISSNSSKRYKITNSSYEDLDDSGWINATLTSSFNAYGNSSTNTPQYRKVGNIVEIRGIVSPTSNLAGSNSGVTIFTLPTGYRPSKTIYEICQGSGRNVWLLTINSNGTVQFSRYGTTANAAANTGTWLCFNKTFTI